ncbi:MAG TPA: SGNH/GDSL hydrolase family protein [Steroidobacteraceae bacterium]|nr:SGNH/GDSL hydrolase family protein [Steroidobacteraceae bacterium]
MTSEPRAAWWSRTLKRVLGGAALLAYTLGLAEAYFRVLDPQPLMPRYVTGTPWGVRGNIPNARYRNHTEEVDVEYRINSQGLRADRDYPVQKPPGTCRVAVFGDSFFFGIELDRRDSFAGQLERRLEERSPRIEVLNFSVGGFGTAEMLRTFEGFGRRFGADAVVFSWDDSDLQDNVRSGLFRVDSGRLVAANAEYLPGVKTLDWLMQYRVYRLIADHSELYAFVREQSERLVKEMLRRARRSDAVGGESRNDARAAQDGSDGAQSGGANGGEDAAPVPADDRKRQALLDLSSDILLRSRDEVESSGADFYLVEIPFKLSRTRFRSGVDVLPAAVRSQLNVVYTYPALSRAARPGLELYYESGQGHLTPTGVSVLVDEAVKSLASSPRLAACLAAAPQG